MKSAHATTWSIQDAKNKLSAVVDAARDGQPQTVTRRGRPEVVVVSIEEYERLRRLDKGDKPKSFVDALLAMPKGDVEFERMDIQPRDVDFGEPG